jgi:hypothetical protein
LLRRVVAVRVGETMAKMDAKREDRHKVLLMKVTFEP